MRIPLPVDRRAGLSTGLVVAGAVVLVLAIGLGVTVAFVATSAPPDKAAGGAADAAQQDETTYEYIPFGTSVVNLAGGRLTRYLQVSITLKANAENAAELTELLNGGQKSVFKNWLLIYLSGKTIEEVEGPVAIKLIQQEVLEGFNAHLSELGDARIADVLVEEFNIQ